MYGPSGCHQLIQELRFSWRKEGMYVEMIQLVRNSSGYTEIPGFSLEAWARYQGKKR